MSQCNRASEFTCWDGECIPLDKMCDVREDCDDGRDENACTFVNIEKNKYRKNEVPRNPVDNSPLVVNISFDVHDLEIDEPQVEARGYCITN